MPPNGFYLNKRFIPWDRLETTDPGSPFEKETLDFLISWQQGDSEFQLHTSGSTGNPKKISLTREQFIQSARQTNDFLQLTEEDHAHVCLNTAFIAGKIMIVRALISGMTLSASEPTTSPSFNAIPIPVTFTAVVPLQLEQVLKLPEEHLDRMKAILVGGASVSSSLLQLTQKHRVPIYETYGMTETVSHIALKRISGPMSETTFRALPGIFIRQNEEGCLEVKGAVTQDTWITTSDIVKVHGENNFEWLGRKDLVINSGGIKIHPELVEREIGQVFNERQIRNRFFIAPKKQSSSDG